jgi:ribosomal protein S18 acetylase RimI-like enzyme
MEASEEFWMLRKTLADVHEHRVSNVLVRSWQSGDESAWLYIHQAADSLNVFDESTFQNEFDSDPQVLAQRQVYAVLDGNRLIGTATAWFPEEGVNPTLGRIHWVAVLPSWQGRGVGRALVSEALTRLAALGYSAAYLSTSQLRKPAISLYHGLGFEPVDRPELMNKL